MKKLKEYEKHVISNNNEKYFCGENVIDQFHFLDVNHLFNSLLNKSRILPCSECLKVIIKTLKS